MDAVFRERVESVGNTRKLIKLAIRELAQRLRASQWSWSRLDQATSEIAPVESSPASCWTTTEEVVAAVQKRSALPDVVSLALGTEARRVDILVFHRPGDPFAGREVQDARALLEIVEAERLRRRDQRHRRVLERSYGQLLRRLRGNDLHYRLLHSIRELVPYDHSAAVFVAEPGHELFRLQAEQVAWTKGRSALIGQPFDLGEFGELLRSAANRPLLFRREDGGQWMNRPGEADPQVDPPRPLLDFHGRDASRPSPHSALLAPLDFDGRTVGVLAAFGLYARSLTGVDVETLRSFVPLAAIAVHNQRKDEDLERAFIEQQKRHAVPDVARGVAHDINNALGSLLLRARALREDLEPERDERDRVHLEDVRMIEQSAAHCRRIFQGLLHLARRGTSDACDVSLDECVRHVLNIEGNLLQARGVHLEVRIAEDLPRVRGQPQQLEQLVHNLLQNARQASRAGDRVLVGLRRRANEVRLVVANDAVIPRELQARVFEPFFTTRSASHGLGLALCRAIVVDHGGQLRLRSRPGRGTWVEARLPVARHARGKGKLPAVAGPAARRSNIKGSLSE